VNRLLRRKEEATPSGLRDSTATGEAARHADTVLDLPEVNVRTRALHRTLLATVHSDMLKYFSERIPATFDFSEPTPATYPTSTTASEVGITRCRRHERGVAA